MITEVYVELKKRWNTLKLVLVPRHAERGNDVVRILEKHSLAYARRSESTLPEKSVEVLLADTTGEMIPLMSGADIVVMGKSFSGHNEGHNLIEPALLKKPIVTGTVLRNFRFILQVLESNNAVFCCGDTELAGVLEKLIESPELRREFGSRAFETINLHSGAIDTTIDALQDYLK